MGAFHDQLADAVRLRQKAINGVLRWQKKKQEAEALIEKLSASAAANDQGAEDDGALLDENMKPVFGITEEQTA